MPQLGRVSDIKKLNRVSIVVVIVTTIFGL
jgi:hypothetical protein